MKRIFKRVLVLLLCIIALSYLLPSSSSSFLDIYKTKDAISASYENFNSRPLKSITVNNTEWRYYSGGKGDKTILLLHGMGGTHSIWWQQILNLEQSYHVISYTLPVPVNNLNDVQEGIEAILKNENTTTFYALGSSMGGYITQYLMQKMPHRVEKVILANTFPPNDLQRVKNAGKSKIIPFLPEVLVAKLANKQLNSSILPAANNSLTLKATLGSIPFSKKQFINRYHVVVDTFTVQTERIQNIAKLIIESNNDPLVEPELRTKLKNVYSDAQVYTFKREGHFPYVNDADTYNTVIRNFFDH